MEFPSTEHPTLQESLLGRVARYLVDHADLINTAVISHDIQETIQKIMLHKKVKPAIYPILSDIYTAKALKLGGMCALEGISDAHQIIVVSCNGNVSFCPENSIDSCISQETKDYNFCSSVDKDKKILYLGALDGSINVWDYYKKKKITKIAAHDNVVSSLAVDTRRELLSSGDYDGSLKIWNTTHHDCLTELMGHTKTIKNCSFLSDGSLLSASFDAYIKLWDLSTEKSIWDQCVNGKKIYKMTMLDEQHYAAYAREDKDIVILDTRDPRKKVERWQAHILPVSVFLSDQKLHYLVSGFWDGIIKVWDLRMTKAATILDGHREWVQSLAALHNMNKIVSGSRDRTLKIWDLSSIMALENLSLQKTMTIANWIEQEKPLCQQKKKELLRDVNQLP